MNKRHAARLSLVFLPLSIGLMACSGSAPAQSAPAGGNAAVAGPEAAFLQENNVAMDRMMAGMDVAPTGDVDRDFARMMIPHHQGAIDMAQALLRHGKNEELKALAQAIIAKQQEEIALMRRIVGEPAPAPAMEDMAPMGGHHHHESSN